MTCSFATPPAYRSARQRARQFVCKSEAMNASRRRHAHELYATSHEHDQDLPRLERFRNLEPPTAELLGVLIRAAGSRRILELGTSNGYSTIWLADAAEANGGRVVSVDLDRARTDLARESLLGAGLETRVELRTEDAGLTLGQSADSAWDFIFLDSERPAYPGYVSDLVRTLAPAGILAVDNVLSHEDELVEFTALIEAREDLTQTVVPVGAGLRLGVRGRSE
jgi:predicted O-methyltransferase YrrM